MPASPPRVPGARSPRAFLTRAFLASVGPALERAYGVEADPDFPDEIAVLLARLQAEPDGFAVDIPEEVVREAVPA